MKNAITLVLGTICLILVKTKAQDTLLFEEKWPYLVRIVQETETKVFYRKINQRDTFLYVIEKRFVSRTGYEDQSSKTQKFRPDPVDQRPLDIWVTTYDSSGIVKGYLHSLNDTTLYLRRRKWLTATEKKRPTVDLIYVFPYKNIAKLQITQRPLILQYALMGAATGFATGYISGLIAFRDARPCDPLVIDGQPCDASLKSPITKTEKSLIAGFAGAGAGALTGGLLGTSMKIVINIKGNKDRFNHAIPRLRRWSKAQQIKDQPLFKLSRKKKKKKFSLRTKKK